MPALFTALAASPRRELLQRQDPKVKSSETPTIDILLALCQHRLSQKDAADRILDQALAQPLPPASSSWPEKLLIQALRREAEVLLASERR